MCWCIFKIEKKAREAQKGYSKRQTELKEDAEKSGLERIKIALLEGKPARLVELSRLERESIRQLCFLTMKPVNYVADVAESDLADPSSNPHVDPVSKASAELDFGMVVISAQFKYCKLLAEKYGEDCNAYPDFNKDLWNEATHVESENQEKWN